MEKLELKHLAPYLPYRLWFKTPVASPFLMTIENIGRIKESAKPLLRPLSDLTKEFDRLCGLSFAKWSAYNSVQTLEQEILNGRVTHSTWQVALELHFDVFGLIPKGLAIKK